MALLLLLAQDLEPRRWTHLPVGTNSAGLSYAYASGDLHVDPAIRIEDAELDLHMIMAAYTRYFALGDMTARVDVQVPFQRGRWEGRLDGVPTVVRREGFADPRLRLSVNVLGAPALEGEAFQDYLRSHESRTTAGAAIAVRLPLGEYMDDKLINLGDNRFSFQPQAGVVHSEGPWSFEATASMFIHSDNDDFFDGRRLEKDPLYAIQTHVTRTFEEGFWMSAGAAYGRGGESEIDGVDKDDLRSNLLYGLAVGLNLTGPHAFRLDYIRHDALEDVGADTHNFVLGWALRF